MTQTVVSIESLTQTLSVTDQKIDLLCDQNIELQKMFKEIIAKSGGNSRATVSIGGLGAIGVICASISMICLIAMGVIMWAVSIELSKQTAELHDLRAWRDIHQNHISALEAKK